MRHGASGSCPERSGHDPVQQRPTHQPPVIPRTRDLRANTHSARRSRISAKGAVRDDEVSERTEGLVSLPSPLACIAAPHPGPLPVLHGERGRVRGGGLHNRSFPFLTNCSAKADTSTTRRPARVMAKACSQHDAALLGGAPRTRDLRADTHSARRFRISAKGATPTPSCHPPVRQHPGDPVRLNRPGLLDPPDALSHARPPGSPRAGG